MLGATILALGVPAEAAAPAAAVTLPNLRISVPTSDITIAPDTPGGPRMLRYTHVTWDAGTGPFEIDPTYDPATGTANFVQVIYTSAKPGVWTRNHTVSLPVTGVFDEPDDYRFPLTSFTLRTAHPDGSPGAVVAASPKTDYCVTGDTFVGGVPNTPARTFIPASNCQDPTKPLGWSVGWGDEYDQTDPGQPIDLTGVPDGTYVLRGDVDPRHVLTESNVTDDVTDTLLRITGTKVTVLGQNNPAGRPPAVTLTSPAAGTAVSGGAASNTVPLRATATAVAPATVRSVQFLLDGLPLGPPDPTAPYGFSWRVGSTTPGPHLLSADVTDSAGGISTAATVPVTVVAPNPGGPVVDQLTSQVGRGTVTTAPFSTAHPGDVLLAFVGADGPIGGGQAVTVSGAGLTWTRVRQSAGQPGDAEIWTAIAPRPLLGATVTSTEARAGFSQQVTVAAATNARGIGAAATASARTGAPTVSLVTTAPHSLLYAVGDDWDNAVARTPGPRQMLVTQWLDHSSDDTFWVQGTTPANPAAGQLVALSDTAPVADRWNLAAVEIVGATTPPPVPPATDTTPPTISIVNPAAGQTVSGTIPVAVSVHDDVALASVRYLLDGAPLGAPVTAPPYATAWDTRAATPGRHTLAAQATDPSGNVGTSAAVTVTVANPSVPDACFIRQAQVDVHGAGTVTTAAFHTAMPGETLLAFVGSDGPAGPGAQHVTVTGAGLRWKLVTRANSQSGDAEIWTTTAPAILPAATVTSTPAVDGYDQSLTVIAMEGTNGVGAAVAAGGPSGAPTATLTTTTATSLVFAVGNDYDQALARTRPPAWVSLHQWLDTRTGDTYWSQYTGAPIATRGTAVTVTDPAPVTDRWNLAAVELRPDDD